MAVSPSLHSSYRSPRGKVVHGKDGWLFLHRDTNRVMGQQSGEIRLDANQLTQWRVVLDTRTAWIERQGAPYVVVIVPNVASIYPEMLPKGFETIPDRPVRQLLDHLSERGSPTRILYPEAELLAMKQREAPFARNDTHWTDPGAFRGYERLLDELAPGLDLDLRRLTHDDLEVARDTAHGDLGRHVEPAVEAEHVFMHVRDPRARLVSDNRIFNTGRTLVYECADAPGTCVVVGDSMCYMMLPFLAETFGRVSFSHRSTLDFELIEAERPDAVVTALGERTLVRVPFDQPFTPTRVLVRKKREVGEVLAPRDMPYLRPDVWPPLNLVED